MSRRRLETDEITSRDFDHWSRQMVVGLASPATTSAAISATAGWNLLEGKGGPSGPVARISRLRRALGRAALALLRNGQ